MSKFQNPVNDKNIDLYDVFEKKIEDIIKSKKYVVITKNITNPDNKKLQKKRIIGDYMIPLSYIIYSYS